MPPRKKIGVIGAGNIGRSLIKEFLRTAEVEIGFVLDTALPDASDLGVESDVLVTDVGTALSRHVDLVIEAAVPEAARALAPQFLAESDFCAFSSTSLADAAFETAVRDASARSGRTFFVPHGAVLGIDGIVDGRNVINSVRITTTKSGRSLGLEPSTEGVVFEGTTREACMRFPRNVNVHATVAAAGIGFDRTLSRIIAVATTQTMEHQISVIGNGLSWDLHISSMALAGVTGSYTPLSAIGSVRRILGGGGLRFA